MGTLSFPEKGYMTKAVGSSPGENILEWDQFPQRVPVAPTRL